MVNKKSLNTRIARLNKLTDYDFELDYAYGQVKVVRNSGSGQENVSIRGTKREIFHILEAMIHLAELPQKTAYEKYKDHTEQAKRAEGSWPYG